MTQETGRVVATEGECVWVETISRSSCQSCAVKAGCGHGVLNQMGSGRHHHVRALLQGIDPATVEVGDTVEIAIPDRVLVGGALLVYLLPLVTLLAGAGFASHLLSGWLGADVAAFIGALSGFGFGLVAVKLHSLAHRNRPGYQPRVVRVSGCAAVGVSPPTLSD